MTRDPYHLNKEKILEDLIAYMDISEIINVLNKLSEKARDLIRKFLK